METKLVISDLDQTLVDLITIHNEVTRTLFRREFGVDARLTDIDFAGKGLPDNFLELAIQKGISESQFKSKKLELLAKYEELFESMIPVEGEKFVLPGAKDLLSELKLDGHFIVLYTGGSRRIGETVLRITGLDQYFRLCFYATESKNRAEMVQKAIVQAGELAKRVYQGHEVVIIGDSLRDVECGKLFNALTISVTTGFHSRAQLEEKGADFVFASLRDWPAIISVINRD
jgi:phosphoglycolate phosphatase